MKKYVSYKLLATKVERILITGAGGFIGRHLVEHLSRNATNRIYALGRETSDLSYISQLPPSAQARISVVRCNLADRDRVMELEISPDVIIHTAAKVSDYGRYHDFYRDNVEVTQNLLGFARALAGLRHFIHFSTIDVYGYQDRTGVDEGSPLTEGKNTYNTTKITAEKLVQGFTDKLPITILRPATVIGRYNKSLIIEAVEMLKARIMFYFRGGNRSAGLLDVRNLSILIQDIIRKPEPFLGQTFNVVDSWQITWRQFFDDLGRQAGFKDHFHIRLPYWISYGLGWLFEKTFLTLGIKSRPPLTRLGVQLLGTHQQVSDTKLRELGYSPAYDYAASIRDIGMWIEQLEQDKPN